MANSKDDLRKTVGCVIQGFLYGAFGTGKHSTTALVLSDGTALVWNSIGAYWIEPKEAVDRALAKREQELRDTGRALEDVLALAGKPNR